MQQTIIKNLINRLSKSYGYKIIEFKVSESKSLWGIETFLNDHIKYSVFVDINDYRNYENNLINNSNLIILLVKPDEKLEKDRLLKENIIVIDYINNNVIYAPSQYEKFILQIINVMAYINQSRTYNRERPVVTYGIILINVLMYIISSLLSNDFITANINVLIFLGGKYNPLIQNGEYYRLITCMFLHGGAVHVALNMYSLYCVGPFTEKLYGKLNYFIIYMVSGIISSIFSFMFSNSVSIGASGAIFGVLGALAVFAFKAKHRVGNALLKNILICLIINIGIGLSIPNIDNFGHIGGLTGGILISILFYNKNKYKELS